MNAHYSAVLLRDDRNAMPDAMEADAERYPLLRYARRVDIRLRPGDLLLVPGGAPHRVVNAAGGAPRDSIFWVLCIA